MSDQGNSQAYSPDKVAGSYKRSAMIFAIIIAAAGFLQFTVANKQKVLVQAAATAQLEYATTQRIAMLTAQHQVTHDDSLLPLLKQAATDVVQLHESLTSTALSAMLRGTLTDQANMQAGAIDKKIRELSEKAYSYAGGTDTAADGDAIAQLARQDIPDAWQGVVNGYITGEQKQLDLFSKAGFGLCGAMLLVLLYQMSALFTPAMAYIKAQRDHLEHMGSTDLLTGFYNRAMLFKVVATLISGSRRHKNPLAILAVDIDEFKVINDKYGRAAGDAAIKKVGIALSEVLRTSDVMGRVGGQEFAVFLPSTDEYRASFVAEKLRAAIENLQFTWKDSVVLLRVSVGVAQLQDTHKSTDDMLRAAEYALQNAKTAGRNRVATFSGAAVATSAPVAQPAPAAAENAG